MKKKNLARLIVGTMSVLVLTACGGSKSGNAVDADQQAVQDTQKEAAQAVENDTAPESSLSGIPAADSFEGGSGTEADPYQIATKEQLRLLADKVNNNEKEYVTAFYVLNNDVLINPVDDIESWGTTAPEYNWTVIGNGQDYCEFMGHFDGQGHTISGLYYKGNSKELTGNSSYAAGLFGIVGENAVIENVVLKDSKIIAATEAEKGIGGIVGETDILSNAVIRNCENYADIESENGLTGGVVGVVNKGAILENCRNYGNVQSKGGGYLGGVAGSFKGYRMSDCENHGNITGSDSGDIGGVVGEIAPAAYFEKNIKNLDGTKADFDYGANITANECTVTNLYNAGSVKRTEGSSVYSSAGVAGSIANGGDRLVISGLVNDGEVSASDKYVGGVIGSMLIRKWVNDESLTTVSAAENHSDLVSVKNESGENNSIGGVFGYLELEDGQELSIENCTNTGNITGNGAGVANMAVVYGGGRLSVKNCENSGNISSSDNEGSLGGVINMLTCSRSENGTPNNITVEGCVNKGTIDGSCAAEAGIIGWAHLMNVEGASFTVKDCENSGDVSLYYTPDCATSETPRFAAGIIGWFGIDDAGAYEISGNTNLGNVLLKSDGVDKDTLSEEIKYYRAAAIVGMGIDNAKLSGNNAGGNLLISSLADFSYPLKEVGMELTQEGLLETAMESEKTQP